MAVRFGRIEVTIGADKQVRRKISGIPVTNLLVKGWLTVKAKVADLDTSLFQKVITTTSTPGQGHITDDGNTDGAGEFLFELTAANSALLAEGVLYEYDIQAKQADGKLFPVERGTVIASRKVTSAAS